MFVVFGYTGPPRARAPEIWLRSSIIFDFGLSTDKKSPTRVRDELFWRTWNKKVQQTKWKVGLLNFMHDSVVRTWISDLLVAFYSKVHLPCLIHRQVITSFSKIFCEKMRSLGFSEDSHLAITTSQPQKKSKKVNRTSPKKNRTSQPL